MTRHERCEKCKFATMDYVELYGSTQKHWSVDGCRKEMDMDSEECEVFDEYK